MKPCNDRPDHSSDYDGNKKNKYYMVEPEEKPKTENNRTQNESRPYNPPEGPVIYLNRCLETHAVSSLSFIRCVIMNAPKHEFPFFSLPGLIPTFFSGGYMFTNSYR
jgi:hypothetical protein